MQESTSNSTSDGPGIKNDRFNLSVELSKGVQIVKRLTHSKFIRPLLAVLFVVIVPLLRAFRVIESPKLWAEDGALFLTDAWDMPGIHNFFVTYNGYLHTIPRLVAAIAVNFPLITIPTIFLIASWIVYAIPIIYFLFKPGIEQLETRIVLCCVYACLPIQETYLDLTNLMWYTVPAIAFLLAVPVSKSLAVRLLDDAYVTLAAFTGPFSIFLLPASVLLYKTHKAVERPMILGIGAATQLWFLVHSPRLTAGRGTSRSSHFLYQYLQILITTKPWSPVHIFGYVAIYGTEAALCAFAVYVIWQLIRNKQYFVLTMLSVASIQIAAMEASRSLFNIPRYSLLPVMAISMALAAVATDRSANLWGRAISAVLVASFLWSADQRTVPRIAPSWASQVAIYDAAPKGDFVHLTIEPPGTWHAILLRK